MTGPDIVRLQRSTVAFWDVAGSTALYRAAGNQTAERLIRTTLARARVCGEEQGGRVVKPTGDGLMLDFPDPDAAARACREAQRTAQAPLEPGAPALQLRMGFCEGEVVERDGDLFGDCVNLAARLCERARPGFILTTGEVGALLGAELRPTLRPFGETLLKGITGAVSVVQVLWNDQTNTVFIERPVAGSSSCCLELRYQGTALKLSPKWLPITLGRATTCTLVVPAPNASRLHLRIDYRGDQFVLTDESSNGTYVRLGHRPDDQPAYVRNDSFHLIGSGALGLGATPDGDPHAIEFSVG